MKQIYILGCSHTAGAELHDEHVVKDYWDFKKFPVEVYLNREPDKESYHKFAQKIHKAYNGNMIKYDLDCKQWAWPAVFKKIIKTECDIIDHSLQASGIDFIQYLYNLKNEVINHKNIIDRKDLKKNILNSDLLIWQISDEPRYFLTSNNENVYALAVQLSHINWVLNFPQCEMTKWKKKIMIEYYENVFDIQKFFKEKINFLHRILYQRILAKKHTIIFSVYNTNFNEYKKIKNKYVHYLNDISTYEGIVHTFFMKNLVKPEDSYCKFLHPSKKVHRLMADHINNYIIREGLL